MKKKTLILSAVALSMIATSANAQFFKKIKDKVKQEANDAVNKVSGKNDSSTSTADANTETADNKKIFEDAAAKYDFHAGGTNVFKDNFEEDSLGAMAKHWKTSGSGSVQTFPNEDGKFLSLKEFTSYKLRSDKSLPQNFTIEFDIATHSNTSAKDLEALSFGFAHDNNISDYISDAYNDGAITATQIHYWNKEIMNSSSDTQINNTIDFPLAQYAIATMHVAVAVNGNNMRVYLDKVKVLDTDMFSSDSKNKYFYISTSTKLDNGAKVGISNFSIDAI